MAAGWKPDSLRKPVRVKKPKSGDGDGRSVLSRPVVPCRGQLPLIESDPTK
jgi:hypothetical protein